MKKKSYSPSALSFGVDTGMTEKEFHDKKNPMDVIRDKLFAFSFNGVAILKALVCGILLIFFALFQTTLFARFRPFGVVPDLILPLVCAIGMTEHEKWGAIFGIVAAFVIESLGGSTVTLLPLLYMPAGYLCGILTTYYLRDSITVRAIYVAGSAFLRSLFTLFTLLATVGGITLGTAFSKVVLPELLANILFGLIPHYTAKLCLRPFNKTRAEKIQ